MFFYSVIDSVAFRIGPLSVHWYGIIIGSAIFLALYLALREAKRLGINQDYFVDVVMFGVPAAIIGARLYYVAFRWEYYGQNPGEIIAVWQGGLAIHGGLIGALLAAYIYTRVKNISFWMMADVAAPSFLLGKAMGRWGNFINQEAHGGPITEKSQWIIDILPWWIAEHMNIGGVYYHPTFLYESLWNVAGILLIIFWLRRQDWVRRGDVFLGYAIWYSVGRFFIEGMRTDSLMLTETLRIAQVMSGGIIIGAAVLMWYRRANGYADKKYGEQ
ncbi:prolipoprotein diacylglyceryl transferase [Desulfuribacillus alkaliarsenatis]|uniref:Phosphatidylglycerol--prolipoprotein diacylglyceryl transferase n=1 Tax=Desulfuribacillus alkaliarsenatis TaxID=766136 RepID=A0A1E5G433_9FIRM|nr:prolipoprotein diacylglyceryl transferase [Desulfuribacillus alkaliarsenatis]OEF97835.1 prolipoprotein diacylglyceryl transferase [Desulfuribacillus alkaliarsenatis]